MQRFCFDSLPPKLKKYAKESKGLVFGNLIQECDTMSNLTNQKTVSYYLCRELYQEAERS